MQKHKIVRYALAGVLGFGFVGQLAAQDGYPPSGAGRYEARISDLETKLSEQTGAIEELRHKVEELSSLIERLQKDIDIRFDEVAKKPAGRGGNAPKGDAPQNAAGGDENPVEHAKALILKGQHAEGEKILRGFIEEQPKSKFVGMAYYWVGESHMRRKQFQQASLAYVTAYKENPKSAVMPDNLYKLGKSLAALGKKQDACTAWSKLVKDFPNAPEALKKQAATDGEKAGCSNLNE